MEFGSALRVLLRRWLVVLLGVALTMGAAAYLYSSTAPTYRATARLLLLLPPDARGGAEEEVGSPFLYLPNGLNVLARVVASDPNSKEFNSDLLSRGLTSAYEVGVDPSTPIITVGVEGPDPDNVVATRDGLVEGLQRDLAKVQTEEAVPSNQTARSRVFAAERTPIALSGNRTRGVLAVLAAGLFFTLLAAFGADRILEARRSGLHRTTYSGSPESVAPAPDVAEDALEAEVETIAPDPHAPEKQVESEPAHAQS